MRMVGFVVLYMLYWTGLGTAFVGGADVVATANGDIITKYSAVSISLFMGGIAVAVSAAIKLTRVFSRLEARIERLEAKVGLATKDNK